jgi:class 3 adenylate cyclase/CHASE2 domain-containing sensor protein
VKILRSTAFVTGLLATSAVWLASALGAFDRLELRSEDSRFQSTMRRKEPLSDQLALVAIDDGALASVGRWPWPRSLLALAIDELARAGARTVALDLLLSEPDDANAGADAALASALAARTSRGAPLLGVVGVSTEEDERLTGPWRLPGGERELAALLDVLGAAIDMEPADAAAQANLSTARRESFLAQPIRFKQMAAWRALRAMMAKGPLPSQDDFMLVLTSGRPNLGAFDARVAVEEIYERGHAWALLKERLGPPIAAPDGAAGIFGEVSGAESFAIEPVVPALAGAAAGVGVVTSDGYDPDGAKRRTKAIWPVPGGACAQFGLASAATHLGLPAGSVAQEDRRIVVGDVELPARAGTMLLDWPSSTFESFADFSGDPTVRRPTISIAALISLSRQRQVLAGIERERDDALARVMAQMPVDARAASDADVRASEAQRLSDLRMDDKVPHAVEPDVARFLELEESVSDGAARLADASKRLRAMVDDRLVFVGWIASGALADQVTTPYGPRTPGVFVHAVAADMVIERHSRSVAAGWVEPAAIVVLGLAASLAAALLGGFWSFIVAAALVGAWWFVAARVSFDEWRVMLPLMAPVSSPVVAWAASTAAVAVSGARDRARITRQFAARVSPQLVARLANNPDALSMSGEEREITVVFGDLAGFTSIAESLGGPGVVATLNRYLGRLADELVQRGAYVNKFLGDGFMAFWSAFGAEPEQERLAAESAAACQLAVDELAAGVEPGAPRISLRIGIATGMAVVGDCGAPPRLNDYTAIGDVVNLSARLESANKQFGTKVLMDGATRAGIERIAARTPGAPVPRMRHLGQIVVVGQSRPIDLYEVVDASAEAAWIDDTEAAVRAFRERDLARSKSLWHAFESRWGQSKLSQAYLAAIDAGDGAEDGVLRLRAK